MTLTKEDRMSIAGHRGDCYNYYENTMTAFKKAVEAGADMVETDVRLTKDNVLILMHDEKVDRTTNGRGMVSDTFYRKTRSFKSKKLCCEKKPMQIADSCEKNIQSFGRQ